MNQKRNFYLGIFIIFSTLIVTAYIIQNVDKNYKWDSSDSISSSQGTLQQIIDSDLLKTSPASILDASPSNPGHNLSEIWVSVNGVEMTFKDAIINANFCGITSTTNTYSNAPDPTHLGTEIEVTTPHDGVTKSLQDAINDESLVSIDGGWSDWNSWSECSNTCGATQTRTRTCDNPLSSCGGNGCTLVIESYSCGIWNLKTCYRDVYNDLPETETRSCDIPCMVNEVHTETECTDAGGTIYTDTIAHETCSWGSCSTWYEDISFCRFSGSSCPAEWTKYLSWSSTSNNYCVGTFDKVCSKSSCDTRGHSWADKAREDCTFYNKAVVCTGWLGLSCSCKNVKTRTCYANVNEIGCY